MTVSVGVDTATMAVFPIIDGDVDGVPVVASLIRVTVRGGRAAVWTSDPDGAHRDDLLGTFPTASGAMSFALDHAGWAMAAVADYSADS